MKKSRFTEEKIIDVLKHLEAGRKVSELKRLKTLVADLLMDLRPEIGWAGLRLDGRRVEEIATSRLRLCCWHVHFCRPPPGGPALLQDRQTTVCESQLRGDPPKYWASPEELLPRYADGVLVGRHTEG